MTGRPESPTAPPLDVVPWPLVGRRDELREMERLFARKGRGVILAGAAGVGKTRLAAELLSRVGGARTRTLRVVGTRAASGIPLGAFAPVLPPPSRDRQPELDGPAHHLRLRAQQLMAQADGGTLAILVDDAHLLDNSSATLVHQLATYAGAFVVITVRSDEPYPDPILALWKDDTLRRMEVTSLSPEQMHEVLHAVLGPSIDRGAVHRLATASGGNAMFLRELVLGAIGDGTLRFEQGIWGLVGAWSPSSRLAEIVESRLSGLTEQERLLVDLLAVGEPLAGTELQAIADPTVAEELERRGFLASRMDGTRLEVRLAHPVYAHVLKATMSALRRRELACLLVRAVEATGAGRDVLRSATWRLEAGGPEDPDLYAEAALIARWRYDFALAERLAVAARESGAGFEACLLAAELTSLQGRGQDAERLLAELADEATTDRQRGLVACARLDNDVFRLGRIEGGLAIAEAAEQRIGDPAWRDSVAARRGAVLYASSGPRAHLEAFGTSQARANTGASVYASIISSNCLARVGRISEARDTAERAIEMQATPTEHFTRHSWTHLFCRNEAIAYGGQIHEAVAAAEAQYEQGLRLGSLEQQSWFAWQLCTLSADRGYFRSAVQYGREAVTLFRQFGWPLFEHFALTHLALAHTLAGDAGAAAETLRQDTALDLPKDCYWPVDREAAHAWIAATTGDLREATRRFRRAAEIGESIGDHVAQAGALHALARIGQADQVVRALDELAQVIEGDLIVGRAEHARALATGDAHALEAVAEQFEVMGATMLAAEAVADASVQWRRQGEPRRATRLETRSAVLSNLCESPATPALHIVQGRARLTPSERETAMLASNGRSNKDIALQLRISVRTVENHLQRAYGKLGVSGRSELAAALSG